MRLKSIKLAGFKSFVDPTTVSLPSNMCAVVGPNGCGKSNVIDAVRWVMGESSAKNLRGESMADVIFNGSVNRQPVGQATIELVFDNADGGIGGEYASYAEISIRRLVTRDGQSEYFLNGTRCRRRDITDIFLGTGLGPRSYAIIEQGMISRLIESRPEDLRVFIEEAAGISRYKERRKETEARMRRTLENLERLRDLREELERQLQHLQRQAQSAEKYRKYREEERELKAQLYALEWQELARERVASAHGVGELEVQLEAVLADHQQIDTEIEKLRVAHSERSDAFNELQGRFYSAGADVSRTEQAIRFQQERARELEADLARTQENLSESERHLEEDRGRLAAWDSELSSLLPDTERLQAIDSDAVLALSSAEEAMQTWQASWDEFNQKAAQPRQESEVQQSRIQHLEHALKRLQVRVEQLQQEQAQLAPQGAEDNHEPLRVALEESEQQITQFSLRAEALAGSVADAREAGTRLAAELSTVRSELSRVRGQHGSLEALQQAACDDGEGLAQWFASCGLDGAPRLLTELAVNDGWQLAVETVLGEFLQGVCVADIADLDGAISTLTQGRISLLEDGGQAVPEAGSLAAQVSDAGRVGDLLASVRTASSQEDAFAMRAGLASHESVITRDGLWLGRHWLRLGRDDAEGGVIRRQQALEELSVSLNELQQLSTDLEQAQLQQDATLRSLEQQRQDVQRELQQELRRNADLSAQLQAGEARLEQLQERRDGVARDIAGAHAQFTAEQTALAEARQLLAVAIERMDADSGERERLLSARDETRSCLDTARQHARQSRDAAHQAAMRQGALQTQVHTMRETIERTQAQVAQLTERADTLRSSVTESENPVAQLQQELEQHLALRLAAEGELTSARQLLSEVEHALRSAEQQRAAVEQRAATVRSSLEQQRLQRQTLEVQCNTVQRQLTELKLVAEEVLAEMPEDANRGAWQERLERVAAAISRLGAINLAAIDEFGQQSERKQYLDAQNEDLESALATLEAAIRKIDRETRSRFQETFDKINSGLQELFPRVFGGGNAYLEMTGDDLLNTGISIMARPPGKKNSTIHLLSGGEKALTAIALVFSIFQLNPAPFCMLDEVDAPLDDANVGRYARMVKEMSEKVQFIFITHNKITMEMADQLLGVTMHEPGVSRLVSVDVEEAAELAAS